MELKEIRQEIDVLDTQMKELYLKRLDLSEQVAAAKKETGGAVYVPEREQEILEKRTKDVVKEKKYAYREFLLRVMSISRTHQYALLFDEETLPLELPKQTGEITLECAPTKDASKFAAAFTALSQAGLSVEKIEQTKENMKITVNGDFSKEEARGAVLQILQENESLTKN